MKHELIALLYSYIYLFGIVFLAELIRKQFKLASTFTRRVIHIGVGIWGIGALMFFNTLWAVLIPPASFVIINTISYKTNLFKAMEIDDKENFGTIFYPLSLCILLIVFWPMGHRFIPFIALLIMALGDGFASIVGQKIGRRHYTFWATQKSIEGSLAMLAGSFLAACLILFLFGEGAFSAVCLQAAAIGMIATLTEAISPGGVDNLTVPLISGFAYWIIFVL